MGKVVSTSMPRSWTVCSLWCLISKFSAYTLNQLINVLLYVKIYPVILRQVYILTSKVCEFGGF